MEKHYSRVPWLSDSRYLANQLRNKYVCMYIDVLICMYLTFLHLSLIYMSE